MMKFTLNNTFTKYLPADPIAENTRRQVQESCFSYVKPTNTKKPEMMHVSEEMLQAIGLNKEDANSKEFLNIFSGNKVLAGSKPYAMCYGGHQFGNWAGQLGDGRAINLAEIENNEQRWALQLKGAGATPYSRTADGLAVLRSSIREYLCSEAMHHLGVPTSRALSVALSGDQVLRDIMYNGNQAYEKGAIVCRAAPSFLRFGSFEIFAARRDFNTLKVLLDYTIEQFFPHLGVPSKETYVSFFKEVAKLSLEMVIHWQRVGFVHGVMNTDNMSILGLTIDYGPYGWLEGYDPNWTPNTTDSQHRRYRFGNQPDVVLWNLYQLANTIFPLIEEAEGLEAVLESYKSDYEVQYLEMMKSKIGLFSEGKDDAILIKDMEDTLQLTETDMTLFFRKLSNSKKSDTLTNFNLVSEAFYNPVEVSDVIRQSWKEWFERYSKRLEKEELSDSERKEKMNKVNPKYVLRNYMAQLAIDAADNGDYSVISELFTVLKSPYSEQPESKKWFAKRPEWARHKVGCSMLSCSS